MEADFFFRRGSTHAICQDYAIAGAAAGRHYALLSDGCSGVSSPGQPGSPYTDFGARFLVRAAQQRIDHLSGGIFPEDLIHHAASIARRADLPATALDATLLVAVTTSDGDVLTFQTGDGVIASRQRDGSIRYRTLTFGNGMPFYLSYVLDAKRRDVLLHPEKYEDQASPERVEAAGTVEIRANEYVPGTGWLEPQMSKQRFEARMPTTVPFNALPCTLNKAETEVVLLMSDGAESFQKKDGATIPLEPVLEQLFAIKGFNGQFLVRRCSRFVEKFCVENGWRHSDDFSVAGIHLGSG